MYLSAAQNGFQQPSFNGVPVANMMNPLTGRPYHSAANAIALHLAPQAMTSSTAPSQRPPQTMPTTGTSAFSSVPANPAATMAAARMVSAHTVPYSGKPLQSLPLSQSPQPGPGTLVEHPTHPPLGRPMQPTAGQSALITPAMSAANQAQVSQAVPAAQTPVAQTFASHVVLPPGRSQPAQTVTSAIVMRGTPASGAPAGAQPTPVLSSLISTTQSSSRTMTPPTTFQPSLPTGPAFPTPVPAQPTPAALAPRTSAHSTPYLGPGSTQPHIVTHPPAHIVPSGLPIPTIPTPAPPVTTAPVTREEDIVNEPTLEQMEAVPGPPFLCLLCHRPFQVHRSLKRHIRNLHPSSLAAKQIHEATALRNKGLLGVAPPRAPVPAPSPKRARSETGGDSAGQTRSKIADMFK